MKTIFSAIITRTLYIQQFSFIYKTIQLEVFLIKIIRIVSVENLFIYFIYIHLQFLFIYKTIQLKVFLINNNQNSVDGKQSEK